MNSVILKVRGLIFYENKILAFPTHSNSNFWCLPGGKVEFGESVEQALIREILEETGIEPKIGKLFAIQELLYAEYNTREFFYTIENGSDFAKIDFSKASHADEVLDHMFFDVDDSSKILPAFISDLAKRLVRKEDFPVTIYTIENKTFSGKYIHG